MIWCSWFFGHWFIGLMVGWLWTWLVDQKQVLDVVVSLMVLISQKLFFIVPFFLGNADNFLSNLL